MNQQPCITVKLPPPSKHDKLIRQQLRQGPIVLRYPVQIRGQRTGAAADYRSIPGETYLVTCHSLEAQKHVREAIRNLFASLDSVTLEEL